MSESGIDWVAQSPAKRAVLPAAGVVLAAAEGMHLASVSGLTTGLGAAAATAVTYAAVHHRGGPAQRAATVTGLGAAWLTAADVLGPLAGGTWHPLTIAWAAGTFVGYRALRQCEAIRDAREWRADKADWLARGPRYGLHNTHLLEHEHTRLGESWLVDVTGTGKRASSFIPSDLAERIAERETLPPIRVRVASGGIAGRIRISVRRRDPWAEPVEHPVLAAEPELELPVPCSVHDPLPIGIDPETGTPLLVPIWHKRGARNLLTIGIKEAGKALALDTPLPTPTGWTTMGDVQVGDQLLGQDGKPTTVTASTPVMYEHPCFEVEFSDGTVIVADADHLWLTETRTAARSAANRDRQAPRGPDLLPAVRTTAEIAATLRDGRPGSNHSMTNHAVVNCRPLNLPEADLPVPPYVLGCWLGDGDSNGSILTTADAEIIAAIESEGVLATKIPEDYRWKLRFPNMEMVQPELRICAVCGTEFMTRAATAVTCGQLCGSKLPTAKRAGKPSCRLCGATCAGRLPGFVLCRPCKEAHSTLQGTLRSIGVLNNKHIPAEYLRASEEQRRALLAGLLDTDGYCSAKGGKVEFSVTSRRLAYQTRELISSLGYTSTITTKRVAGRRESSSICYSVRFTPPDKVFRLTRKTARQDGAKGTRCLKRFITDARPVESVPVRCIQVANDAKLYLAGPTCIPTHNTVVQNCLRERITAAEDALLFDINVSKALEDAEWAPACDLAAVGSGERKRALAILRIGRAIIDWRGAQPRDTAVFQPTPQAPLVVINIDEIDALLSPGDALAAACKRDLAYIASKDRSEAVALMIAGQRATADWLGGADVRANIDLACVGKVGRAGEARHAGDAALSLPDIGAYGEGHAGVWGIVEIGGTPQLGRTFNLESPLDIRRLAHERAGSQPSLEPDLVAHLGPLYAQLKGWDATVSAPAAAPAATAAEENGSYFPVTRGPSPVAVAEHPLSALDAELDSAVTPEMREQLQRMDARAADTRRLLDETGNIADSAPKVDPAARKASAQDRWADLATQTEIPPDSRARILDLLAGDGMSASKIAEHFPGTDRRKIISWLNRLRHDGAVQVAGKGRAARWIPASDREPGDAQ